MPNFRRTGKFVSVAALAASTALSGPIAALAQERSAVRYAQAAPTPEELLLQQAPAEEAPAEEAAPAEQPAAEAPPAEEPAPVEAPVAEEPPAEPEQPVVEEPVAEEPPAEPEPPVEEPVEEPVVEEPVAEPEPPAEPTAAEEPAAEAPPVDEPALIEAPAAEEPLAGPEAPVEESAEEPVVEEPVAEEPAAEPEAPIEEPTAEEPAAETQVDEPAPFEAPVSEEPTAEPAEEPVIEEPVAEEPVTEPEPPLEEPAAEEPAVETPLVDEPVAEEPLVEPAVPAAEPAEEPVVEEPVAEEPTTEPEAPLDEPAAADEPAAETPPVGEPVLSPEAEEQLRMLAPGDAQPQSSQQPAAPAGEPTTAEPVTEGTEATDPETPAATTPEAQTTTETPAAGTMVAPNEDVGATQAVTIDSSEVQENNLSITDARVQTFNTNNITVNSVTSVEGDRIEVEPEYELPDDAEVVERVGDREILTILGAGVAGAVAGGLAGYFIQSNDDERLAIGAEETYYEELPNGRFRETIVRPNGVQVVTITNEYGDIVQRSRILPDGREVVLFYDPFVGEYEREFYYADVGADLPPLEIAIPEEEYIVDIAEPNEEIYYETIIAPPVETVERIYSVAEVRRSERIRNKVRRIDLSAINFEFGSATITQEEVADLQALAEAVTRVIEDNPGETFLIEGHTDAVGSEIANLALSDRRAEAVAIALTEYFDIPPENLITQGYGESDLKVQTQEPSRDNRRVTVRRITPLVKPVNTAQAN